MLSPTIYDIQSSMEYVNQFKLESNSKTFPCFNNITRLWPLSTRYISISFPNEVCVLEQGRGERPDEGCGEEHQAGWKSGLEYGSKIHAEQRPLVVQILLHEQFEEEQHAGHHGVPAMDAGDGAHAVRGSGI